MKIGDRVELIPDVRYSFNKLKENSSGIILNIGLVMSYVKWDIGFESYVTKKDLRLIENNMQILTRKQLITLHSQFTCTEWKTAIEELLKENVLEDKIDVNSKLELLKSKGTEEQKEAVKKLKITLPKSYLELHNESGLKVGDKVRVVRKAKSHEQGWDNTWNTEMDEYVGKICKINSDHKKSGFWLKLNNTAKNFPYFVLEKVEEKYVPYTFEDAEKLISKAVKSKNENLITFIGWFKLDQVNIYGEGSISYQELLENYTELDGSPLGKLAEV